MKDREQIGRRTHKCEEERQQVRCCRSSGEEAQIGSKVAGGRRILGLVRQGKGMQVAATSERQKPKSVPGSRDEIVPAQVAYKSNARTEESFHFEGKFSRDVAVNKVAEFFFLKERSEFKLRTV